MVILQAVIIILCWFSFIGGIIFWYLGGKRLKEIMKTEDAIDRKLIQMEEIVIKLDEVEVIASSVDENKDKDK